MSEPQQKRPRRSARIAANSNPFARGPVCVWQNTPLKHAGHSLALLSTAYGVRVKFVAATVTLPSQQGGIDGGRNDVAFLVHPDDVDTFAVRRFTMFAEETTTGRTFMLFPITAKVGVAALHYMAKKEIGECVKLELATPSEVIFSFPLFDAAERDLEVRQQQTEKTFDASNALIKHAHACWGGDCDGALCVTPGRMRWWEDVIVSDDVLDYSEEFYETVCESMKK